MITNIYAAMQTAGCEMCSHASDLYVPVTPDTTALVDDYIHKDNVTQFISPIDGKRWFDIPFGYEPWWTARRSKVQP